jgi:hypothetical protein
MSPTAYADADYIAADPFFGDEAERACQTVAIRTARKEHTCFSLDGKQDHTIKPGERYRHERALIDGSFWGQYRICLACMDKHLNDEADE